MTIPSNAIPRPISELQIGTPTNADTFVMVQNGQTKRGLISGLLSAGNIVSTSFQINTTAPLLGGGDLSGSSLTLSLDTFGDGPKTIGSAGNVPIITYDDYGRISSSTTAATTLQLVAAAQAGTPVSAPTVFTSLQVTTAPVSPNDVYRLGDYSTPSLQAVSLVQSGTPVAAPVVFNTLQVNTFPTGGTDVVRLADLQAAQSTTIKFRPAVRLAAVTTSVGLVYTNNTGLGTATITGTGQLTIDGVIPVVGNRVLLTNQAAITGAAALVSNGPYVVTAISPTAFTLTRTSDDLSYGAYFFVQAGAAEDGTSWVSATTTPTIGTSAIVFTQFFASPNAGTMNPLASGTANAGTSNNYSREDHVHPLSLGTPPTPIPGGALNYAGSVLTYTPASTAFVKSISPINLSGLQISTGAQVSDGIPVSVAWNGQIPAASVGSPPVASSGVYYLQASAPFTTGASPALASWVSGPPIPGTVTSVTLQVPGPLTVSTLSSQTITTSGSFNVAWGTGQIPAANLGAATPSVESFLSVDANSLPTWKRAVAAITTINNASALTITPALVTGGTSLTMAWDAAAQIPSVNLGSGTTAAGRFLAVNSADTTKAVWSAAVTSVDLTVPVGFVVSGRPVTTTGTIAIAYDSANQIPSTSIASGTTTAGYVPTVQANGALAYAAPQEPLAVVYAIALG